LNQPETANFRDGGQYRCNLVADFTLTIHGAFDLYEFTKGLDQFHFGWLLMGNRGQQWWLFLHQVDGNILEEAGMSSELSIH